MKIVRLTAENIKRIRAVEVTPAGELVVVGGKNDAGKSSLLDAIEMAMGGEAATPPQPVRKGEKAGKVILDLGDLIVTRSFTAAGGRKLVVANKEGARFPSPQAVLDRLYGALSFDPLAFERMEPKAQADTLRKLVGLDTSVLDGKRVALYEDRTQANREIRALEVTFESVQRHEDAPAEEVSIDAISAEMRTAEEYRGRADDADREVEKIRHRLDILELEQRGVVLTIQRLQKQLEEEGVKLKSLLDASDDNRRALDARTMTAQAARAAVPDTEPIRQRLSAAEGINQKVRENRQHAQAAKSLEDARAFADALTGKISGIDDERARLLSAAPFPVPGLGIDDEGVTFDGLPFEQASTSDRLRVSVAIGIAANPQLRVLLVRDGSLLGAEKLQLLAEMAKAADCQVWLEMLQESPDGRTSVYIEDGAVKR